MLSAQLFACAIFCLAEPPSVPHAGDVVNQTVLAGVSTQLECEATGHPFPGNVAGITQTLFKRGGGEGVLLLLYLSVWIEYGSFANINNNKNTQFFIVFPPSKHFGDRQYL